MSTACALHLCIVSGTQIKSTFGTAIVIGVRNGWQNNKGCSSVSSRVSMVPSPFKFQSIRLCDLYCARGIMQYVMIQTVKGSDNAANHINHTKLCACIALLNVVTYQPADN